MHIYRHTYSLSQSGMHTCIQAYKQTEPYRDCQIHTDTYIYINKYIRILCFTDVVISITHCAVGLVRIPCAGTLCVGVL